MLLFWGKVRHGDKRGRSLGYPTANMGLHMHIEEGVYVSKIRMNGQQSALPALTFVGAAKTFGKEAYQAETYILNFSGDLYDQYLTVMLLKKLRGNKRFGSAKELTDQMKQDEIAARDFFKTYLA